MNREFPGVGKPIDKLLEFIAKIFKEGSAIVDELFSMCAVTLIMSILEHLY